MSSTLHEQLSVVLAEHATWDVLKDYSLDSVECLMEIDKDNRTRGLIKLGKSIPMGKVVKDRTIHDGILRIFILPKTRVSHWIVEWKSKNTQI
jgi:hypothetical protein